MNFAEFQTQDRRLVLLRGLEGASGYTANSILLGRFCESMGVGASADRIRQDLAWLGEQSLVTFHEAPAPGAVVIATLTERGLDVANGRTVVPGVARPQPGL